MNPKEAIRTNFKGIIDSTLREGEQFNSAKFSREQQKEILRWLTLIGVDRVEVGNPAKDEVRKDIMALARIDERPKMLSHILNDRNHLKIALGTGVEGVNILTTVLPQRLGRWNTTLEEHMEIMGQNIVEAKDNGLEVRVSVEQGLEEGNFGDALRVLKAADEIGANRVGAAETRGVLMPWEIAEKIAILNSEIKNAEIEVHCHNDLGHATSNAILALEAGANWVDTTLLGIGERTGITPLSGLLANLYMIDPSVEERYSLEFVTPAEQYMAGVLGMDVPHNLISSPTAFSHKAGVHIREFVNGNGQAYEGLPPEVFGNKRIIVTGSRISGKTTQEEVQHLIQ
jgi:homocitrate synthase